MPYRRGVAVPVPTVLVGWATGDPVALAQALGAELLGHHPGPLHHTCPTCGSIEHGRPSFDAAAQVSLAHAGAMHLVAVSTAGPVGVDLEAQGSTDLSWVRREAVGKAHGVGIVAPVPDGPVVVLDLDVPGHLAALAVLAPTAPVVRTWPGGQAAPGAPATR